MSDKQILFDSAGVTVAKCGTALSCLVISWFAKLEDLDWATTAAQITIFYTCLLILDWFWKKIRAFKK